MRDGIPSEGTASGRAGDEVPRRPEHEARAQTQLRLADASLGDLLESMPDAIIMVDAPGRIVLINTQAEKLFGYERGELLSLPVEILLPQRYRHKHVGHRDGYFAHPHTRTLEAGLKLFGQRKSGEEFPVEISLSPLKTDGGTLVLSAIRDVTQRKLFEQALKDKNLELENAARVKDRFLASMSHELRTPLNAIIGFTGTLLMRMPGPLNEEQERQLGTIQSSARHLHSLINDLLDLAKIEAGSVQLTLEPVSCGEVLHELQELLRPAAVAKGLAFSVAPPDGSCVVRTDRRALMQILLNLTNNAIKFTDHGSVRVDFSGGSPAGSTARFCVSDTGAGISQSDRQYLFESFQQLSDTARKRAEGTGLGLHLSQKLAQLMGGLIECESEPGRGSRFTLTLTEAAA